MDPKDSGAQDPYRALLFKLTGVGIQRPRLRSAVNTWRKTQRIAIEHEVKRVVMRDGTPRSQLAKLRDAIARKMFERLPVESQKYWGDRAKEEHEAALKRWKDDTPPKILSPANSKLFLLIYTIFNNLILSQVYSIPFPIRATYPRPHKRGYRVARDFDDWRT